MATSAKAASAKGLTPAAAVRGRGPIMMVAVNGLILTIATYLLINMFVVQTLENDRTLLQQEVTQTIDNRVAEAEADFNLLAMLLTVGVDQTRISAELSARALSRDALPFSLVLWFPNTNLYQHEGERIYPQTSIHEINVADVLTEIRASYSSIPVSEREKIVAIPLIASMTPMQDHVNTPGKILRQSYKAVALLRPLKKPDGTTGMLLSILPMRYLMDAGWLSQRDYIDRVRLVHNLNRDVLLDTYRIRMIGEPEQQIKFRPEDSFQADLRGWASFLLVQFITNDSRKSTLLEAMPYAIIFFGLLITGFGAMYVRNNQRQSLKLANMNRTLALKNMELNSQVSERERLNHALRKNERENRAIIDAVSDIIFEVDMSGNFLFLNESWHKITGFDAATSLGHNLFDLLLERDQAAQKTEFEYLVKGIKAAYRFITRLKTAEGTYRTVEVAFSMLRMDESKNLRVVGTITDVEERRRAEAALLEAERQYRTIWENVASGIYQATLEGQMLTANPSLARIFGYESPEAMLSDVNNMHRQLYGSLKDRQTMIRDLMLTGQVRNAEVEGIRRDKSRFWLIETTRVVKDEDGNILYLEGSIDDITQRKEAEAKLREAMLQSDLANRSKTEFLANMSHELRTPLNAIIGFSEIIRDEVFGKLQQRQYWEYAKDIHDSGKSLLAIINTILDVSKIETGERQLNEQLVDIRQLVIGVVELVTPKAEQNQQPITINIPDGLPGLVCEELAAKQILVNLMSNAIKFTPTGGRITIAAEVGSTGEMRLSVTDTGVGLDEDEMNRVMAPFGHAESHFTRDSSGAGLGLTLVNSLMRLHGGRFEMFSQKGMGTTAAVVFPASRVQKN